MRRSVSAAVPVSVSATNSRIPAESFGWAAILLFLLVLAALIVGGVFAFVM